MLAYADSVIILENSLNDVIHTVEMLIASSWNMGLIIKEEKA